MLGHAKAAGKRGKGVCRDCSHSDSPAIAAAKSGHFACLQHLHTLGRVAEAVDETGATPLHAAVSSNSLECAMWLADRTGADMFARDNMGSMPAHHAAYHGSLPCLQWLVVATQGKAARVCAANGGTPIHFASSRGHLDCIKYLCSAEVGISPHDADENGTTPLYFATQEGHDNCVQWFLEVAHADPLIQAHDGMGAMHAAAQSGKVKCLKLLCGHIRTSMKKVVDHEGGTCLHYAASRGQLGCVNFLLKNTDLDGTEKDDIGATPVHDAAEQGQLKVLQLFAIRGVELSPVDEEMLTPLKIAEQQGHTPCANFLTEAIARKVTGEPEPDWFGFSRKLNRDQNTSRDGKQKKGASEKGKSAKKQKKKKKSSNSSSSVSELDADAGDTAHAQKSSTQSAQGTEEDYNQDEQELFDALDDLESHISRMAAVSAQLEALKDSTQQQRSRGSSPRHSPLQSPSKPDTASSDGANASDGNNGDEGEADADMLSVAVLNASNLDPKEAAKAPRASPLAVQDKLHEIKSKGHIVGGSPSLGQANDGEHGRVTPVALSRHSPHHRATTPRATPDLA